MSTKGNIVLCLLTVSLVQSKAIAQPVLAFGTEGVAPGSTVGLPVWLVNSTNLAGLQFEFRFDPQSVKSNEIAVLPAAAGVFADAALAPSNRCRVVLVSTNHLQLSNGLLASIRLATPADAPDGALPLPLRRISSHRMIGTTTNAAPITDIKLRPGQLLIGDACGITAEGGRIQFRAADGTNYLFQASTNLFMWSNLGTNIGLSNLVFWIDSDVTNFPHRFYRLQPP